MTEHQFSTLRSLLKEQHDLEVEMREAGRAAFLAQVNDRKQKHNESETGYAAALLRNLVVPVAKGVRSFLDEVASGKPGRRHVAAKYLALLDPEVVAVIALRRVLDDVSAMSLAQKCAVKIATALEDEVWFGEFRTQQPQWFKGAERKIEQSTSRRHSKAVMRYMANAAQVQFKHWPEQDKLHVGMKMIDIIQATTGMIEVKRMTRGPKDTILNVVATEATMKFIAEATDILADLSPARWPMIVKPRRWSNPVNGGYRTGMMRDVTLVKTRNKAYLEELSNLSMEEVYAAINAIQETPWKVNTFILEAMEVAWDRGLSIGKLPSSEPIPLPARPFDIETNEEAKKDWKRKASVIHTMNAKSKARRIQARRTMDLAKRFSKYERIYFPHQMDFRGRVYAIPMFLNPQGADPAKALLTFAEGKPIEDEVAAGWLAIHGANLFGFDKASLENRIGWVEENENAILSAGTDPYGPAFSFWSGADKPWQFLAWCREWTEFQANGWGFVSSLPVSLDGSCNGLQHYSAALRDPVGGAAVNLVPSAKPEDIYQRVADVVISKVTAFVCPDGYTTETNEEDERMAKLWLEFGIDRKITKRPVMTLPYGSTLFSCREFIEEAVREKIANGSRNVFETETGDGIFQASRWLQSYVWESIGEVVKAARVGMDWLKSCASLAGAEGLPVVWYTPDGFMVTQSYKEKDTKRVKTVLDGKITFFTLVGNKPTIDKRRQAQGIAPNWVHSMDATAMRMYVNHATAHGVRSHAMVHDSFGTVAADVETMGQLLREAFVELYTTHDPLAEFRVDVAMMLSDEALEALPPVPEKGDLDVELVRESDFFFA